MDFARSKLLLAGLTFVGHGAFAQTSFTAPNDLRPLATACSAEIYQKARGLAGTTTMTGFTLTTSELKSWGGLYPAAFARSASQTYPMVEASALDGGAPGSAWKACLAGKIQALNNHQ